jgi:hypothetical protein
MVKYRLKQDSVVLDWGKTICEMPAGTILEGYVTKGRRIGGSYVVLPTDPVRVKWYDWNQIEKVEEA